MRGSLSRARLLAAALVVVAFSAVSVSAALANSATTSGDGIAVTASLSPDTVSKGDTVFQDATVKNTSRSSESVNIRIIGPLQTVAPVTVQTTLAAGASFSKSLSFPAGLLAPGTHSLTVVAVNRATGAATQATATIKVN